MNTKTSKKVTIIALIFLILCTAFVLALLFTGTLSASVKTSEDMDEGIAIGCTGAVIVIVFLFTLIVKGLSIIFGVSSLFVKRKLSSILVLGILTCILAIVSLICSVYCFVIFQDIQNGSPSALLMNSGLVLAVVSDIAWLGSIIFNTIVISKTLKALPDEEVSKIV